MPYGDMPTYSKKLSPCMVRLCKRSSTRSPTSYNLGKCFMQERRICETAPKLYEAGCLERLHILT